MSITLQNGVHVRLRVISALPGERGIPGPPAIIKGTLASVDDLPPIGEPGDIYTIDGDGWAWDGMQWVNAGRYQGEEGPQGPIGPAPNIIAGTVITLMPGTPATAAVNPTENPGEYEIDLGIPQGEKGDKGDKGDSFDVDATGPLDDRYLYDSAPNGFSFLATDTSNLYIRQGAPGGWSDAIPFGKGDQGPEGPAGPGVAAGGTTGQALLKQSGTDYDTVWATLTKASVGLGSVDDTSDLEKPISTDTQTALNLKAPLISPIFTGTPAAPTATVGTNTTQIATTEFVMTATAKNVAVITTSGNFTVPDGVYSIDVQVWGGGGGGGGSGTAGQTASGGGGGGYSRAAMSVTPGQVIAAVVGAAGSAGTGGTKGGTGGTSSFGGLSSTGGVGGDPNGTGGGGNAGTGSGGTINLSGSNGGTRMGSMSDALGGAGGSSPFGGAGGPSRYGGGSVGVTPGGGGAGQGGGAAGGGSDGAPGLIVIAY